MRPLVDTSTPTPRGGQEMFSYSPASLGLLRQRRVTTTFQLLTALLTGGCVLAAVIFIFSFMEMGQDQESWKLRQLNTIQGPSRPMLVTTRLADQPISTFTKQIVIGISDGSADTGKGRFSLQNGPKRDNDGDDQAFLSANDVNGSTLDLEAQHGYFGTTLESLNLCDETHRLYHCENDATCSARNCFHHGKWARYGDPDNWQRFWKTKDARRAVLTQVLQNMEAKVGKNPEKELIVVTFNAGFAHLFGNWDCSLQKNGVDREKIKRKTLVLATDEYARAFAESLGYYCPTQRQIQALKKWTNQFYSRHPSPYFARLSHSGLNLFLKFSMPLDLVHLGYTVMIQDVDIVWMRDAFQHASNQCGEGCDAVFIQEKRPFMSGRDLIPSQKWVRQSPPTDALFQRPEVNTGMFILKASPKVEEFLALLLRANKLQQFRRRDQALYNTFLYHKAFTTLNFRVLPWKTFVPGKYTRLDLLMRYKYLRDNLSKATAIHVSDTANYIAKYWRFAALNHWYLTERGCPASFQACKSNSYCFEPLDKAMNDEKTRQEMVDRINNEFIPPAVVKRNKRHQAMAAAGEAQPVENVVAFPTETQTNEETSDDSDVDPADIEDGASDNSSDEVDEDDDENGIEDQVGAEQAR